MAIKTAVNHSFICSRTLIGGQFIVNTENVSYTQTQSTITSESVYTVPANKRLICRFNFGNIYKKIIFPPGTVNQQCSDFFNNSNRGRVIISINHFSFILFNNIFVSAEYANPSSFDGLCSPTIIFKQNEQIGIWLLHQGIFLLSSDTTNPPNYFANEKIAMTGFLEDDI